MNAEAYAGPCIWLWKLCIFRSSFNRRRDCHLMTLPDTPSPSLLIHVLEEEGGGVWGGRRRDCHFAAPPSGSLLKHLLNGEGVQQDDNFSPTASSSLDHAVLSCFVKFRRGAATPNLTVGETDILLHRPLPLVGVPIEGMKRGCRKMTVSPTAARTAAFLCRVSSVPSDRRPAS